MRIKTILLSDTVNPEIRIAALTLEQAEKFLTAKIETDRMGLPTAYYEVVSDSLNNCLANGEARWTPARVKAEFDLYALKEISEQIMIYSGLAVMSSTPVPRTEESPDGVPGEPVAAAG